ncbi:hypothetical protein Avbf_05458 [Armadillidium vulgare]|nr:hypothetical protein Avbf_05458 [Armadillidium vulgare]
MFPINKICWENFENLPTIKPDIVGVQCDIYKERSTGGKRIEPIPKTFTDNETNNHFVQSFSLGIPVKRISVLCFEYFASFLDDLIDRIYKTNLQREK